MIHQLVAPYWMDLVPSGPRYSNVLHFTCQLMNNTCHFCL
jgi:hypothetical protein